MVNTFSITRPGYKIHCVTAPESQRHELLSGEECGPQCSHPGLAIRSSYFPTSPLPLHAKIDGKNIRRLPNVPLSSLIAANLLRRACRGLSKHNAASTLAMGTWSGPGSGHLDSQVSPRQVRVTMTIIGSDQDLSPVKSGIVHDQIHYTVHSTHWAGRSQRNPENATMKCAK